MVISLAQCGMRVWEKVLAWLTIRLLGVRRVLFQLSQWLTTFVWLVTRVHTLIFGGYLWVAELQEHLPTQWDQQS